LEQALKELSEPRIVQPEAGVALGAAAHHEGADSHAPASQGNEGDGRMGNRDDPDDVIAANRRAALDRIRARRKKNAPPTSQR